MTTGAPDDDGIDPMTAALAEQARIEAERLPTPEQVRGMAEEAVRHGGAAGMSTEEVRRLADTAIERAEQVTDLLRRLSTLLREPGDGDAP